MAEEVSVAGDTQVAFEVSTTVTESLLVKVEVVKISELVPLATPFTYH